MSTGTTEMPKGWILHRFASLARQQKHTNRPDLELLSVYLDRGVIRYVESAGQVHKPSVDLSGYQVVRPGDLVMNNQQAWRGSVGVSAHLGIVSPAYVVCALSPELMPGFASRLFRSPELVHQYVLASKGVGSIQRNLVWQLLRSVNVAVPSLGDQVLIARYLDHAEVRIAKAIVGKTDLLTKLLKMRRAKVAAGILGSGAGVRVHDGLPFEVPSSWSIEPFWAVAPEVSVSGHPEKELLSVYLDRGVIRYSESGGQVHKPSLDLSAYQLVRPHDLVLNNQQAWRGSVGVSRHEGIISPAYVVCRLDDRFDTDFANLLFRSPVMVSQFELASRGVGSIQRQLHRPSLRVLRVPIPPRSEQGRIASQLIAETRGIDAAAESLREEIALLKEYRTRLISDVVTGKIDVREEAANLPDIVPAELAAVLAGGAAGADEEEVADGDD